MSTTIYTPNIIRPVRYKSYLFNDYGIDKNTGDLWSFRRPTIPKKIKGSASCKYGYTRVKIESSQWPLVERSNGRNRKTRTIPLYQLICHTLVDMPIPEGVSKEEWERTPLSVKNACREMYCVNHIDHNSLNHHPSNLEFVTSSGNTQAAIKHYKSL